MHRRTTGNGANSQTYHCAHRFRAIAALPTNMQRYVRSACSMKCNQLRVNVNVNDLLRVNRWTLPTAMYADTHTHTHITSPVYGGYPKGWADAGIYKVPLLIVWAWVGTVRAPMTLHILIQTFN